MSLDAQRTPEFVRWTIARPCALRDEYRWTDPEQTERLLRPVRAAGEAIHQGRTFDGVAFASFPPVAGELQHVRGFLLDETLAVFGGRDCVAAACDACPANASSLPQRGWAGCYGMFYLDDADAFHAAVEHALRDNPAGAAIRRSFHEASPLWYGFWIESPLIEERASRLLAVLTSVVERAPNAAPSLAEFLVALQVSLESRLPMYARLVPAGRRRNGAWKLDPHCKRCGAPRVLGGGPCGACGVRGEECAGRTRKVRGERPYAPLIKQLGAENLARLISEYNNTSAGKQL
jgi:hypothetical protein